MDKRVIAQIPLALRGTVWFEAIFTLLQEQNSALREQNKLLQEKDRALQEKDRALQQQTLRVQQQAEQITSLKTIVQELKDELARMKKLPKRPKFRQAGGQPKARSGLPNTASNGTRNSAANTITPCKVQQEIKVKAANVPVGSRFKGYSDYVVQELEIIAKDITYKLEIWQTPEGKTIQAVPPTNLKGGHFGPELRAFVHNLYGSSMTEPEVHKFLIGLGVKVSTGQVHNFLMDEVEKYRDVSKAILAAGLQNAPYISADDTGAKHQHKSGYCTHIGGEYFACYKTTFSKSRSNFLEILLQGKEGYWINEAFMRHISHNNCKGIEGLLKSFKDHLGEQYGTIKEMGDLLESLKVKNKTFRLLCIEAGLIGFITATLLRSDQVLISDRAGQFAILDHAACWVHMERPLRKLNVTTDPLKLMLDKVRGMIWDLYEKVKIAAATPSGAEAESQKAEINTLYDKLIGVKTTSPGFNTVIKSFAEYRPELLKALGSQGLPLHNNASERDIRSMVKRRNISGSTKSDDGKAYRDALMTIKQTCFRLGVSFFSYMKMWFCGESIDLALMIKNKYRNAAQNLAPNLSG